MVFSDGTRPHKVGRGWIWESGNHCSHCVPDKVEQHLRRREVGRGKWVLQLFYSLTLDGVNKAGLGTLRDK